MLSVVVDRAAAAVRTETFIARPNLSQTPFLAAETDATVPPVRPTKRGTGVSPLTLPLTPILAFLRDLASHGRLVSPTTLAVDHTVLSAQLTVVFRSHPKSYVSPVARSEDNITSMSRIKLHGPAQLIKLQVCSSPCSHPKTDRSELPILRGWSRAQLLPQTSRPPQ